MNIKPSSMFGSLSAPRDSTEYAEAIKLYAQAALHNHDSDVKNLNAWLKILHKNDRYKKLVDPRGNPFRTWRQFCETKQPHGLGYSPEAITKIIAERKSAQEFAEHAAKLNGQGRPKNGEKLGDSKFNGTTNDYLTARIARDRPDILDRMKAGDFPSVRAAAIEAGIVKEKSNLDKARGLWAKLSDRERKQFLNWIASQ